MEAKDLDLEAILEDIDSLDEEYWRERFKVHDKRREKRCEELKALILYLIDQALEDIVDYLYTFYGKYSEEGIVTSDIARQSLTARELNSLKDTVDNLVDRAEDLGVEFDKDVQRGINNLENRKRVSRLQGLILKIHARIELACGTINLKLDEHMGDTVQDAYLSTLYEIFYAAGYGSKDKSKELEEAIIIAILSGAWRSSGESSSDTAWRYKRQLDIEVSNDVERQTYFGLSVDELLLDIEKLFGNTLRNLKVLVDTDSTYFSTKGQERAFDDLDIEEALYCTIDDERRTEICTNADGSIIPVDAIEPWVNAPPLHYGCRSWLTPIIQKVDFLTGEVYEVADESYTDWYDTWV